MIGPLVLSLIFAIVFAVLAYDALSKRHYGWLLLLVFMAAMNGTMFVINLMEAIQ